MVKTSQKRFMFVSLGLIVAGVIIFVLIYGSKIDHDQANKSLTLPQDWAHFEGAKSTDAGIHFDPVGRVLTHKDTSAAQLNPPVNVRGSHLKTSGDFQIETEMSDVDNGASLWLYTQVPIVYDEWRQERGSVKIEATGTSLNISIWDGTSQSSVDERVFEISPNNKIKVTLSRIDDSLVIKMGRKTLGYMPDHGIFVKGSIWVGAEASLGSPGWVLNKLNAKAINSGTVEVIPPSNPTAHKQQDSLKTLASGQPRNLPIGAAVSIYPMFSDDEYSKLVLDQFSIITPENSLKPQFVHPQKNLYAYKDADSLVEIAQANHVLIHGHALVLGKANPQWMQKTPESERKQVMTDHINNVVSHFKGKVAEWDVVNEPLSEDDIDYTNGRMGLRKQMWFDAMGESYIDSAFLIARTADPSAKLYLNDYGIEKDGKRWDALVALVQRLQSRGVPVDGVGFESHVYKESDAIDANVLRSHMQTLASLGIVSRISEIDVLGDDAEAQAAQYADILKVCLSEPSCTSYTTWGVTDLYGSTTLSDRYPTQIGHSLLWTDKYKEKPVVSKLRDVLSQH